MMTAIDVRPARADDAERIAAFNVALAFESEQRVLDLATVTRGVTRLLADPAKGFYLVAERAGVVVGQLLTTYEWSDWRDGTIWWLQSVYVAPDARRAGVFRALYAALELLARQNPDVVAFRLYVEHANSSAMTTYQQLGFVEEGYRIYERPVAS